ncbi:hypothetical protein [Polymorphospora rubra]|uniref:Uncharacterized protein n=1 Tax=Polymorphospora rubra TaxID=338584 RepID=A0A810MU48_9ACTN|nr:hypothetical protein [Polymorphospora rubra]BCJ64114.1 hypothetical protein Prubr_11350 [Polymorphospora rubra]
MTTPLPRLHPFPRVAAELGIPLRVLREGSWARKFTHIKAGRERYFTDEQLADFIASLTVASTATDAEEQRAADLAETRARVERARSRPRRRAA